MTPEEATTKLLLAAKDGNLEAVKEARLQGGNPNGTTNGGPLLWASHNGHLEIVKYLLLEAGADWDVYSNGDPTATPLYFAEWKQHAAIAEFLKSRPHEIIFERPVSNRILEEVFNFSTLERISLIRKTSKGDVEAMTRDKFSDIDGNDSTLRKAFDEHRRRGGKTEEAQVFPFTFRKPRMGNL